MSSYLGSELFVTLSTDAPLFLVWLVGFIWALATYTKHPHVSLLVALAMVLFAFKQVAVRGVYYFMPVFWLESSSDYGDGMTALHRVIKIHRIINLCNSIAAGLWLLVLAAVFSERKQAGKWAPDQRMSSADNYPPIVR